MRGGGELSAHKKNNTLILFPDLFHIFYYYSIFTLIMASLFTLFSTTLRAIFVYHHQEFIEKAGALYYLFHCFWIGSRLDLKIGLIILIPIYLLGIATSFLNKKSSFPIFLYQILTVVVVHLCFLILLSNYYYYQIFDDNFNNTLFEFMGQPSAVLSIIWQDYPIISIFLIGTISIIAMWKFTTIIKNKLIYFFFKKSFYQRGIRIFLLLATYLLLIRGGISYEALGTDDTRFSSNHIVNAAANNAVLAFYNVIYARISFSPPPVSLQNGLDNYNAYFNTHLQQKEFSFAHLFTRTTYNSFLENNPPNVVFVQMEGAGSHLLLFDDPKKNDLLGSLRSYTKKDLFFTRFLSSTNGTLGSLTSLIFSYNLQDVPLYAKKYKNSVALPYKKAGYETIFLTSGSLAWHSTGSFLHAQGFDRTIGELDLVEKYPNVVHQWWGVADKYVFDYAITLLKDAQKRHRPLFIYINTITNHAPYYTPSNYTTNVLSVPLEFAKEKQISPRRMLKMLGSYQYANTMLGNFIHEIEQSNLKANTIIAASGDHNQHDFGAHYTNYKELAFQHGVFFLLHVPQDYLPNAEKVNMRQLASHKDIFPTLYNLSLSNARYINLGNNLLAPHPTTPFIFASNDCSVFLPTGVIQLTNPNILYPWQNEDYLYLKKGRPLTPEEQLLLNRIYNYFNLSRWQIIWQHYNNKIAIRL